MLSTTPHSEYLLMVFTYNHKENRGCGLFSLVECRGCVTGSVYVSSDSLSLRAGGKSFCTDSVGEVKPQETRVREGRGGWEGEGAEARWLV